MSRNNQIIIIVFILLLLVGVGLFLSLQIQKNTSPNDSSADTAIACNDAKCSPGEICELQGVGSTQYRVCTGINLDQVGAPTGPLVQTCAASCDGVVDRGTNTTPRPSAPVISQNCDANNQNIISISWTAPEQGNWSDLTIGEGSSGINSDQMWVQSFGPGLSYVSDITTVPGVGSNAGRIIDTTAGKTYTAIVWDRYYGGYSVERVFTVNSCAVASVASAQCNQSCDGNIVKCVSDLSCVNQLCRRIENPSSPTCTVINNSGIPGTLPNTSIVDDHKSLLIGILLIISGIIISKWGFAEKISFSVIGNLNFKVEKFSKVLRNFLPYEQRIENLQREKYKNLQR